MTTLGFMGNSYSTRQTIHFKETRYFCISSLTLAFFCPCLLSRIWQVSSSIIIHWKFCHITTNMVCTLQGYVNVWFLASSISNMLYVAWVKYRYMFTYNRNNIFFYNPQFNPEYLFYSYQLCYLLKWHHNIWHGVNTSCTVLRCSTCFALFPLIFIHSFILSIALCCDALHCTDLYNGSVWRNSIHLTTLGCTNILWYAFYLWHF